MDPMELLDHEVQDEREQIDDQVDHTDPIADFAKRYGFREDGNLSADKFLEKKLSGAGNQGPSVKELRELRRSVETSIRDLRAEIAAQNMERREESLKSLREKFSEAMADQNEEEALRISQRIAKLGEEKVSKEKIVNRRAPDFYSEDSDDVAAVIEDFAEKNPWVAANQEVTEFVKDELAVLTKQGYSARVALRKIARMAQDDFPDLFDGYQEESGEPAKRRSYTPPVGGGRPNPAGRSFSLSSIKDPEERREAQVFINKRVEDGKTVKEATAEWFEA